VEELQEPSWHIVSCVVSRTSKEEGSQSYQGLENASRRSSGNFDSSVLLGAVISACCWSAPVIA